MFLVITRALFRCGSAAANHSAAFQTWRAKPRGTEPPPIALFCICARARARSLPRAQFDTYRHRLLLQTSSFTIQRTPVQVLQPDFQVSSSAPSDPLRLLLGSFWRSLQFRLYRAPYISFFIVLSRLVLCSPR